MRHKLHNIKVIPQQQIKERAEKLIAEKTAHLEKFTRNYPKDLELNVHFNKISQDEYLVSFMLHLKSGVLYMKEKGQDVEALLNALYDRIKVRLRQRIRKERKEYLYKKKTRDIALMKEHKQELKELRKTESRASFDHLLNLLLGDVARYVRQRVRSAQITQAVQTREANPQDILSELYLLIYDRLDQMPDDEQKARLWLYQLADETLEKKFREMEFEQQHLDRLNDIVDANYEQMEEHFTVDADKELTLVEELDDTPESSGQYNVYDLLYEEDEDTLVDEITLQYNREDLDKIIEKELAKLPVFKRTIMDLYLLSQMSVQEIAQIKNVAETEVDSVISEISQELRSKLRAMV